MSYTADFVLTGRPASRSKSRVYDYDDSSYLTSSRSQLWPGEEEINRQQQQHVEAGDSNGDDLRQTIPHYNSHSKKLVRYITSHINNMCQDYLVLQTK